MDVLKDHPVSGDKSSYESIGSKRELLLEDGVEDSFMLEFLDQRSRELCRGVVFVSGDDGCDRVDYQRVGVDFAQLGLQGGEGGSVRALFLFTCASKHMVICFSCEVASKASSGGFLVSNTQEGSRRD